MEVFAGWRAAHLEQLKGLGSGDHPKQVIAELSEDLLARFGAVALIDAYDIYQHLMTYWAEVMQDDVYILVQDGWTAARLIRELVKNSDGKFTEEPDLTLGKKKLKADLVPPALVVARFFSDEQAALEKLEAAAEEAARAIEELDEEHGGEEGLLAEAKTDKGKLTGASVKERLKEIKHDKEAAEERKILEQCLDLIEKEAEANRKAKEAKATLDLKTFTKYPKLTEAEAKVLVVEDKWLARLEADVQGELDRVGQALTARMKLLTERYAAPLPKLSADVEALSAKVEAHLKRMGFEQASMQQLLTGKARLPGFTGKWEVKRLGEIAYIKTGKRNNQDKVENGAYPFFVRSETIERINSYSYDCEAILVPGEGGIGSIFHYICGRFDVHQRVYAITNFANGVCGQFIYYWMVMNFGAHALQNTVKATVDSLRLPTFKNFALKLPPTVEEQTAIAGILSDMDAELSALEAKREKTRALKAGMMQELLTGRIRLL